MDNQRELTEDSIFELLWVVDVMHVVRKLRENLDQYEAFSVASMKKLYSDINMHVKELVKEYRDIECESPDIYMLDYIDLLYGEWCEVAIDEETQLRKILNELRDGSRVKMGVPYVNDSGILENFNDVDYLLQKFTDKECSSLYDYGCTEAFWIWEISDKVLLRYAVTAKGDIEKERRLKYLLQMMLSSIRRGSLIIGYEVKNSKIKLVVYEELYYGDGMCLEDLVIGYTSGVIESILLKLCIEREVEGW